MSHVVVFNSSAKSVKIPTTPVKYLTDVRDEACAKLGVNKDQFTLKYNNKPISLLQQIRLANLAQGARLELVQASRSPTVISVALQLPSSEKNVRLTQKFASNTSLWEILRQFESGQRANYNFTQRGVPAMSGNGSSGAGRLNYEMPVVTVMPGHKEHGTFVELQKTLSQLGFDDGSALLRLGFKNSGAPLEEAMVQISQYFKSADTTPSGVHSESSVQASSVPDPDPDPAAPEATSTVVGETIRTEEPEPEPMEVDPPAAEAASEPRISGVDDSAEENIPPSAAPSDPSPAMAPAPPSQTASSSRNIQIFAPSSSATPQAARQTFNEADYVPTIEHAKAHQAALNQSTRNTRLPSDKEIEEQAAAEQQKRDAATEKGGIVRIRLPDGALIEARIFKTDIAEDIYELVASCLERKNEPFQLHARGQGVRLVKMERDKKRIFKDLGFKSAEQLTFLWDEVASNEARRTKNVLSEESLAKAKILQVKEPTNNEPAPAPAQQQGKAEGKKKAEMSAADKESKIKNLLKGSLFQKGKK